MDAKTPALNIELMHAAAEQATATLRTLSNPDRLMLLCQLSRGELSVSEIEALLDIHQPTLSQQLGVLRNEGLVDTRRDGKRIFYSVSDPKVLKILKTLYELYCPED
jgi:ArsR family transcriptional regulator